MKSLLTLPRRIPYIVWFTVVFVWALIVANARVAWEVVTPGLTLRPGIVRVPTQCRTGTEIMLLANVITMTPGTLSLEVDPDTNDLYVHALYARSRQDVIDSVAALERPLLKALR